MVLTKRICALLFAIAAFMVFSWANFAMNLADSDESHAAGYYIAHTLLIVANLAIAGFLVWLGMRGFKAHRGEELREYFDDREYDEARKAAARS